MAPRKGRGAVSEETITFTALEDGLYVPSIGGVLPEGTYRGRLVYRDGKLSEVYITINKATHKAMGMDSGTVNYNIINDYRAGVIGEDRV